MSGIPAAHLGAPIEQPLQAALLTLAGLAYWYRARALAAGGHPVPVARRCSFFAGVALAFVALVSPLAHLGEELLLAHMAQHLLLADIAALLIVLGLTGPILRPLLAIGAVYRLRVLVHPAVALPLWTANLYLWHLPGAYQAALGSPWLHALEHVCFFGFGLLMWMAVLGPLPRPSWFGNPGRIAYVLAVRVLGAVLANVLLFSSAILYPDYAAAESYWGIAPSTDQQIAGGIMLAEGSIVTLALLAWVVVLAMREGEQEQRLLDLAGHHGVTLEPGRARRAVAGGWSDALAERIAGTDESRRGAQRSE